MKSQFLGKAFDYEDFHIQYDSGHRNNDLSSETQWKHTIKNWLTGDEFHLFVHKTPDDKGMHYTLDRDIPFFTPDGTVWYINVRRNQIRNYTILYGNTSLAPVYDVLGNKLEVQKRLINVAMPYAGALVEWVPAEESCIHFTFYVWGNLADKTAVVAAWPIDGEKMEIIARLNTLPDGNCYPVTFNRMRLVYKTPSFRTIFRLSMPYQHVYRTIAFKLRPFIQLCRRLFVYELGPETELPPGQTHASLLSLNVWWQILQYTVFSFKYDERYFMWSDLAQLDAMIETTRAMLLLPVAEPWASNGNVNASGHMFEELLVRFWLGNRMRHMLTQLLPAQEAADQTLVWQNSTNSKRRRLYEETEQKLIAKKACVDTL